MEGDIFSRDFLEYPVRYNLIHKRKGLVTMYLPDLQGIEDHVTHLREEGYTSILHKSESRPLLDTRQAIEIGTIFRRITIDFAEYLGKNSNSTFGNITVSTIGSHGARYPTLNSDLDINVVLLVEGIESNLRFQSTPNPVDPLYTLIQDYIDSENLGLNPNLWTSEDPSINLDRHFDIFVRSVYLVNDNLYNFENRLLNTTH